MVNWLRIFLSDLSALYFEVGPTQPSTVENAPLATSAATASISGANGLSTDNMGDFARTLSYALRASVPVCNGDSRSIPWQAHSNSIAIVFRRFTSMRSSRRAPLMPMET